MPVDYLVHPLVAVRQQAVVAGPDAAFPAGAGFVGAEVSAAVRVEMHDLQRRPGCFRQRRRVVAQATEAPRAASRALNEQRPAPPLRVGQLIAGQLAVFELECCLYTSFQGNRGSDRGLLTDRSGEPGR